MIDGNNFENLVDPDEITKRRTMGRLGALATGAFAGIFGYLTFTEPLYNVETFESVPVLVSEALEIIISRGPYALVSLTMGALSLNFALGAQKLSSRLEDAQPTQ